MKKTQHAEHVVSTAQNAQQVVRSRLAASWRRSLDHHGLDPATRAPVQRISDAALAEQRARNEAMLRVASGRLDALFQLVGLSGCGVLLTDASGLVLDQRSADGDAPTFESWGLWPGADWSEASEGTNGIGTCLTEARPLTIHRADHFRSRNTVMSCMDAPIFGPDGALIGALDVSSARADQTEAFNRLIGAQVIQTARCIEADIFRASFPKARILVPDQSDGDGTALLAVDGDDLVIGATRGARATFGLERTGPIKPVPTTDLLGRGDGPSGFEKAERAAIARALARANGNASAAARALGIGRATFYRRLKRLGMQEDR